MSHIRQIDLYHPSLHPPQRTLTAAMMAAVLGGTVFLILGLALGQGVLLWWLGSERDTLAERVGEYRERVTDLADQAREQSEPDPDLTERLDELEQSVQALHRLSRVTVESTDRAETDRLSAYLRALGRQMPGGAWLVQLHLDPSGANAHIRGYAQGTDYVTELLEALGWEDAFSGVSFHTVEIEDPEASDAPAIRFRLVAGCEDQRCAFSERRP